MYRVERLNWAPPNLANHIQSITYYLLLARDSAE